MALILPIVQLTTDAHDDFNPASSPDGRTIVFASDRSGTTGLWSMSDAGETSVRPLTSGGDSRPSISAVEGGRGKGLSRVRERALC
jgi:Tol biopolymer transport system component